MAQTDFLHGGLSSGTLKVDFCVVIVKNDHSFSVHETLKSAVS